MGLQNIVSISSLVLVSLIVSGEAQFPMTCHTNITQRIGVCCPKPNGKLEDVKEWSISLGLLLTFRQHWVCPIQQKLNYI